LGKPLAGASRWESARIMPPERPRFGTPRPAPVDEKPQGIPASRAPSGYQATLLKMIDSAASDPRQLRRIVYQFARMNLERETGQRGANLSPAEIKECMQALETAISRVETDCSRAELAHTHFPQLEGPTQAQVESTPPPPPPSDLDEVAAQAPEGRRTGAVLVPIRPRERAVIAEPNDEAGERIAWSPRPLAALGAERPPAAEKQPKPQVEIVYPERPGPEAERARRRVWLWFITWPMIQLVGPIVFCLALYLAFTGHLGPLASAPKLADPYSAEQAARVQPSGLPLPTAFGVYAVSNGVLNGLDALPIKVPDPRVALSAEIKQPSRVVLPDGRVMFIVFRRDLVNSAPQKVAVRVVARVARAVTLNVGKAVSVDLESSWRIRGNAYDFKVSPLPENREMIAIRPEEEDFVLPAGRYALALGGLGYDFSVDGPVTAAAQCLESFEALNGPVFSECRSSK
jgi:hypothetical protein